MPAAVMPIFALLSTLIVVHAPDRRGCGQLPGGAVARVPTASPTCVKVKPTVVGTTPTSLTVALNGGTKILPVIVPSISVSVSLLNVADPLNVEPLGSTTGSLSFFGVSDPQTAQLLNGSVSADAGVAATAIAAAAV